MTMIDPTTDWINYFQLLTQDQRTCVNVAEHETFSVALDNANSI